MDAGRPPQDAGSGPKDAGHDPGDAASGPADAASGPGDASPGDASPGDASAASDAGSVLPDAGKPFDAGEPPDAGAPSDAGSAPRDAGAAVDAGPPTLLLDEPRQVIDGFGGANAWTGLPADAAAKQKVMDLLFSTSKGAGLSIIRNRIPFRERTDLDDKFLTKDASGNYVSSTNPDGSKTFSLDWNNWDLAGTRALYRAIEACGADCQVSTFFSTPWTPPNNRLSNWKSGVPDPVNAPEIGGYLDPAHYRDYADVLADYALGFASAMGNSLTAVSIQNEPNWSPQYESCSWTAAQFAAFVPILRQEFAAKGVPASVLVMAPEDMNFKDDLLDSTAISKVDIVGVHQYDWKDKPNYAAQALPRTKAAGKRLWMTEWSTDQNGNNDPSMGDGLVVANVIHNDLTLAEANAFLYWWLWSNNSSQNNGSLLNVNGGAVADSKRLYAIGQYSRFVRPGWVRIATALPSSQDVLVTAFKDPAGQKVAVVAINKGTADANLRLVLPAPARFTSLSTYRTSAGESLADLGSTTVSSSAFQAVLKAQSVTTFHARVEP